MTDSEDSEFFQETCSNVRKKLQEVLKIKLKNKNDKVSPEVTELRIQSSMQFLALKKLNRLDKLRTRSTREETATAKNKVDTLHLQLQNLLYEVMHLQKEITKCQQFKSKDEEIDLIPVKEFYKSADKEITKPEVTKKDEHLQHLARLDFENIQRTEMNEALRKFEAGKAELEDIIRNKHEKLANLKPQLAAILEKTLPVQDYLNLAITEEKDQIHLSRFLPTSLFILFKETRAFGEACDKNISVKILGELEEAKSFNARHNVNNFKDEDDDEDEDEEEENHEEGAEEETSSKKKKQQRGNKGGSSKQQPQMSKQDERLQKYLHLHPLQVQVKIKTNSNNNNDNNNMEDNHHVDNDESFVELIFSYLYRLQIVGTKVLLNGKGDKKEALLNSNHLLSHLLGTFDLGTSSPNPNTKYLLNDIGVPEDAELPAWALEKTGFFFLWAQNLGGMDFPPAVVETAHGSSGLNQIENTDKNNDDEGAKVLARANTITAIKEDICVSKVKAITRTIQERIRSRLSLQKQISQLEKAKLLAVDLAIPEELKSEFPDNPPTGKIRNWTTVNWEDYKQVEITKHLVQGQVVDGQDFFYRLQINREPATLIALIAVKPDYPVRPPVFCLNLHWDKQNNLQQHQNHAKEFNSANSERIRCLEMWINCGNEEIPTRLRSELLSIQIQRLLTSLDVLLESWSSLDQEGGNNESNKLDFKRVRMFVRPVKGRNRLLPLAYNSNLDVFTHHEGN